MIENLIKALINKSNQAMSGFRKIQRWWRFLRSISPIRTLFFNLTYFSLRDAVRLPVFIYRHVLLLQTKGRITILSPIQTGMIKIGHYVIGTQDERYTNTTWEVNGEIVFDGDACLGRGTKLSVGKNAKMHIGRSLTVSGDTELYCHHQMSIGDECTISWGCLLMDTDFHPIYDSVTDRLLNESSPLIIGKHVWIGCRGVVLKGVSIPDHTIVAADSLIAHPHNEEHCIIGGHGNSVQVLKRNIRWEN